MPLPGSRIYKMFAFFANFLSHCINRIMNCRFLGFYELFNRRVAVRLYDSDPATAQPAPRRVSFYIARAPGLL